MTGQEIIKLAEVIGVTLMGLGFMYFIYKVFTD